MKTQARSSKFTGLFLSELREMLWVEVQMSQLLPVMQQAARSRDFARTLEKGGYYSVNHQAALIDMAMSLNEQLDCVVCNPVSNIIETIGGIISSPAPETVRDMSMLLAAQKVVQYQIVCYENLLTLVQLLADRAWGNILDQVIIDKQEMGILLRELSERYLYKDLATHPPIA